MIEKVKSAVTVSMPTGCGHLHVTINLTKLGRPYAHIHLGKNGGCSAAWADTCAELLSLAMRAGESLESISKKLRGARCPQPVTQEGVEYLSCGDALAKALLEFAASPHYKHLTDEGIEAAQKATPPVADEKK